MVSATSITATSPAHAAGTVDVTVTTAGGTSPTVAGDQFTYLAAPTVSAVNPSSGPSGGGTKVTITGTGFISGATVAFGANAATSVVVVSSTSITAQSPAGAVGTVDVTVTNANGTSAVNGGDQFTYNSNVPTVTAVSPNSGPVGGGTAEKRDDGQVRDRRVRDRFGDRGGDWLGRPDRNDHARGTGPGAFKPVDIETGPYPGLATDIQPPTAVLLTQANGTSRIHEAIFEDRLEWMGELRKMGAKFQLKGPQRAVIEGPSPLRAADVEISDLRAGASLILGALAAEGTSSIRGAHHVRRGYENIERKFLDLGARIERVLEAEPLTPS